ncbi:HET-domain-containing protein [Trematosphaeria pertusa]|uniref:HET-domain-containing protein n=1 Tax=Trematosphaeria pertusa TaxID=390896 RepID=A0A6A6IK91_9PLEO|nr:HET-domain-containing protein [Trematosphaeria pertusa]KAF2250302.1 HET-domain-containing protein [Trematosphaeria pertusa]
MRLLNTSTLRVEEFQAQIPEYVILSHTWEEEEVTFQDVESGRAWKKKGYMKLVKCCERAASDGFTYCWLDTCCIDKTSSAELSEAINSMYQWYKHSRICYAYLADFESIAQSEKYGCRTFAQSRWWTRGWTLQELLAPAVVEFYDANWIEIGTKLSLHEQITEITGIDEGILRGTSLLQRNAAVRMSWAAGRETTRVEDRAYSLMGLFAVNMPLLYGEGERAFTRLQEEIMRAQEDYTLFACRLSHLWRQRGPWFQP